MKWMILKYLWADMHGLPKRFANALDRWLLRMHRAEQVDPEEQKVWCLRCSVPWPCDYVTSASYRLGQRTGEVKG